MAEETPIQIASAVVVPERNRSPSPPPPPPSNKRRPSDHIDDSTKRPRLSVSSSNNNNNNDNANDEHTRTKSPPPPQRSERRRSAGGPSLQEQERKRGQRLFGALLGTIGKFQADSNSARARAGATRRKEIEEKLQLKLKRQNEELEERNRAEAVAARERMKRDRKVLEERAMHLRHANMRAKANYLATKCKPTLYYLPYQLTVDEEDQIRDQLDDVESIISNELAVFDARRGREAPEPVAVVASTIRAPSEPRDDDDDDGDVQMGERDDENAVNPSTKTDGATNAETFSSDAGGPGAGAGAGGAGGAGKNDYMDERRPSDAADMGDVIVEAGEDAVIY